VTHNRQSKHSKNSIYQKVISNGKELFVWKEYEQTVNEQAIPQSATGNGNNSQKTVHVKLTMDKMQIRR
jgi:hypothetical protein